MDNSSSTTDGQPGAPDNRSPDAVASTENLLTPQLYDTTMREWTGAHLSTLVGWVEPGLGPVPSEAIVVKDAKLPMTTMEADFLAEIAPKRLLHVEYERHPRRDLVTRMYNYRGRIMQLYPDHHLSQHVIVLGPGRVAGHDQPERGFVLALGILYLRDETARSLLANPAKAPFAVLTRASAAVREQTLAEAYRVILAAGGPQELNRSQTADAMASIHLDAATINRIRKENGMPNQPLAEWYVRSGIGDLDQRFRAEGRAKMIASMLRARFGDRSELASVVGRLADLPEDDASEIIMTAGSWTEILASATELPAAEAPTT